MDLIFAKIGKLRFGHQVSFSPTKGLLESWYWARPAEMEENKEEEEEEEEEEGGERWKPRLATCFPLPGKGAAGPSHGNCGKCQQV